MKITLSNLDSALPVPCHRKKRMAKIKKTEAELIQFFWDASVEAFFGQETIAPVTNKSIKTLESDRWRGRGIPYRKVSGRVLYQKRDVINWLESHALVTSTSEYKQVDQHA
ncbi:MAG: DNA-binding protein [Legionella sp.]|nr:DNA-binding protein [Legionella sp.]